VKTLLDTLNGGTEWLEKRGVEDARRNMQLFLCHLLGFDNPMKLYTEFERPMQEGELAPLRDMLKQRSQGTPLQHILGSVEFYHREFKTDARALIPRPETEELVDILLKQELAGDQPVRLVDIGTGTGVIGISLHAELGKRVQETTLVDISADTLALAKENVDALCPDTNIQLVHGNLLDQVQGDFDLIVSNPPYIPESDRDTLSREVMRDPATALFSGADGLDLIRQIITQAAARLNPGGKLAFEIGIHQHTQVEQLMRDAGFTNVHTHSDLSGIQRFPVGTIK